MSGSSILRLSVVALLLAAGPAAAQEQQYVLSEMDVTVHVQPDGGYEVQESIAYDFQQGAFSRAYRSVVREDAGALRAVAVTSPETSVDSVRTGETDGVRQVWWSFPDRSTPARFDVQYVLDEALYERGGRNVARLDVMADGAVVPTRTVDVQVILPGAFDLQRGDVVLRPDAGTVRREAGRIVASFHRDRVEEGDDLSVEVSFPKQAAGEHLPTTADFLLGLFLVVVGGAAGGVAAWRWRGPRPERTARRPPPDLDRPMAVALLGNRDGQAFLATLFDLARRGHVTLRHDREDQAFVTTDVVRLETHPAPDDLSDFERRLVDTLGEYETLDDFWSDTRSFRSDVMSDVRGVLFERGWMENHTVRSGLLLGGALVALFGGFAAVVTGDSALRFYLLFGGMGVSLGGFIAAVRQYTWTEDGARRAMALRAYLDHEKSEIERLRETSPARAAERLVDALPWLLLHDEVSRAWIEETKEALDAADEVPELPDGFVSLVETEESASAPVAAFLPVMTVMGAVESSSAGAAGAAGAAGTAGGGAAGGGAGAAGAA
ncbi:DUF2207 domain-containing protein [Salinibacter ruber]|uniref:DUF2207 domain-containing protein n=1 Tax=Salinibacter ruber TaxID=146919 RepID=UPI0017BC5AEA|nr:DUF2207 domain-containing protein [Salinibacter ruber]MBB4088539.1 hypothetical protein [Salinibacter ruber]